MCSKYDPEDGTDLFQNVVLHSYLTRDQEIFSIGRPQPYLAREGIYPGHAVTDFCPIRKSAIAELWKFMLLDIMETECEFWPSKWEKARESQQEYLRIMLKAEEAE